MSLLDLTLQEQHLHQLKALLINPQGVEAAAYILCGQSKVQHDPWDRRSRLRLQSHEVVPVPPEEIVSATEDHVTWSTGSFVRLLQRAQRERLVPGIVHIHPRGLESFSNQDDRNERDLAQLARNRNGCEGQMLSLLLNRAGHLVGARLWPDAQMPIACSARTLVGRHLLIWRQQKAAAQPEAFARQALAFGPEINEALSGLKVAVVGCGGTGSATAMLLARLGVGNIVLIDDDVVDITNLNRLHGSRQSDADAMQPKVDLLSREIAVMGLGVRVVPLKHWVGDPQCRDALRSCDAIFGCTDDHDGRIFLNRFAYFYLVPVLDMGLAIEPAPGGGFRELSGRITVLVPGAPCLLCRNIADPVRARDESLRRQHPEEYERRKREAYVTDSGNPAPAVVTFTTETACLAIDEFLQGLIGFRGEGGWQWQRTRRFDRMEDHRPGANADPNCPVCGHHDYWGRGDVEPFLDRAG